MLSTTTAKIEPVSWRTRSIASSTKSDGGGEPDDVSNKVVSLLRDDWEGLQFGGKIAGCSAIWFGWNYADPEGLYGHLSDANWRNITLWWQHENDNTPSVWSL